MPEGPDFWRSSSISKVGSPGAWPGSAREGAAVTCHRVCAALGTGAASLRSIGYATAELFAEHGAKVVVKYHLMEEQQQAWPDFLDWFSATPLCQAIWQQLGRPDGTPARFAEHIVHELVRGGALLSREGLLHDA